MNRAELKAAAKLQIKDKIGILFGISLIIWALSSVASFALGKISVFGSLISTFIVGPAFALSQIRVYLMVIRGGAPKVKDVFCGFDDYWSAFKVIFLSSIFATLWSFLFVIPGIIKMYSYSMATYILAENKGKSALECINESKKLTQGHKMELFVLDLTFVAWYILGALTLGIGYIWILPYRQATFANAYQSLKLAAQEPMKKKSVAK